MHPDLIKFGAILAGLAPVFAASLKRLCGIDESASPQDW